MSSTVFARLCAALLFVAYLATAVARGQQPAAAAPPDNSIHLDVLVRTPSGEGATGLAQQDFTLLDNKNAQQLTSFKAIAPGQEPVEIILVMDAVDSRYETVSYEQGELQRFLRDNPKLPHPTTIAVLTDKGVQIQKGFASDGNQLSHLLDGYSAGLRTLHRSAGYWGATERLDICLTAVRQLTAYASALPGRKIVLWISPGWPLLSGVRSDLDNKQQRQIFNQIVDFSSSLRAARITLYNVNPRGLGESLLEANYYQSFTKGIRRPNDTQLGNLGLQVLAVQSGGFVVETDNDLNASLRRIFAETDSWYELTFPMPAAEKPNEYHHLEVHISKPGLTARTRDGYYAEPEARP